MVTFEPLELPRLTTPEFASGPHTVLEAIVVVAFDPIVMKLAFPTDCTFWISVVVPEGPAMHWLLMQVRPLTPVMFPLKPDKPGEPTMPWIVPPLNATLPDGPLLLCWVKALMALPDAVTPLYKLQLLQVIGRPAEVLSKLTSILPLAG